MPEIPQNITRKDLLQAIARIDELGLPDKGHSSTYDVIHEGKTYPPKVVVSLANIFANGKELDRLSFSGGKDTACFKLLEREGFQIVDKDKKSYWFVGASFQKGAEDRTEQFCADGVWVNAYSDRDLDDIKRIKVGERIAIKSTYTRKNDLPFDANGLTVSVMAIKAIGVVTENKGDGLNLQVDWTRLPEKKEWFFYTQRGTIWEIKRGEVFNDALIDFTFKNKPQDYALFRNSDYWKDRFGDQAGLHMNINLSRLKEYQHEFLKYFPECDSFQTDDYINRERAYKVELKALFDNTCRAGLESLPEDSNGLASLAKSLTSLFTVKLEGMDNKPQNLVGWRYTDFIRFLSDERAIEFVRAVAALLYGVSSLEERITAFQNKLVELISSANDKAKAAQLRSITSFFLALFDVQKYGFIKTQELKRAIADLTGSKIIGQEGELLEAFEFYSQVRQALEGLGWKARDLIDVQSFLYVCQAYAADELTTPMSVGEGSNEDYQMDTNQPCNEPLNQILYGPPGTGKTYNTVNKALQILDPQFYASHLDDRAALHARFKELKHESRLGFVTFHQSFSYEDFVEGLKATSEEGEISYEVADGIFKQMCEETNPHIEKESSTSVDVSGRKVWKMSLGNTLGSDSFVYDKCIEADEIRLGYGDDIDFAGCSSRKEISTKFTDNGYELKPQDYQVTSVDIFKNQMNIGDMVIVSDGNLKFRAIAEITADYQCLPDAEFPDYGQTRKVIWHRVYEKSLPYERVLVKKFSQMTLYKLSAKTVDMTKLQSLLSSSEKAGGSKGLSVGQKLGNGEHEVVSVSNERIRIKSTKSGSVISFDTELIDELLDHVRNGALTIDDIAKKRVFENCDTRLEKFIVNGYSGPISKIVRFLLDGSLDGEAVDDSKDNRVLIIDEINRGNISSIFGELITLIEPSKRAGADEALSVTLPYSKEKFQVPSNLYLIGTMNTADRSLALMDTALRRRFDFVEMMPNIDELEEVFVMGVDIPLMLETMNRRIEVLYDREHTLGHAFFMPLKDEASEEQCFKLLQSIFANKVLPLLEEYFFEDWEKIRLVLGDNQKKEIDHQFVTENQNGFNSDDLFGSNADLGYDHDDAKTYSRNTAALGKVESYIAIYES